MATLDQFEVIGSIGSGSFGTVTKIRRKCDAKIMVWKELNYGSMSEKEKQLLVNEVNILREFRHQHIIRYFERIIDRDSKKIFIIMEFAEGGDLAAIIKKHKKERTTMEEEFVWKIFLQLCLALKECHSKKERILHRDLKPGNVLLDAGQNVKLGDFGLARIMHEHSRFAHTNVGTPFYMSPEQINEQAYNEKSDIWALGCVMYEMCNLAPPFEASNQIALAMKIRAGVFKPLNGFSREISDIVSCMLQVDPMRRPNIDDLLNHPVMQMRNRERKLNQHYALLKQKEAELKQKETSLEDRERAVEAREREIARRERELDGLSPSAAAAPMMMGRPPMMSLPSARRADSSEQQQQLYQMPISLSGKEPSAYGAALNAGVSAPSGVPSVSLKDIMAGGAAGPSGNLYQMYKAPSGVAPLPSARGGRDAATVRVSLEELRLGM